MSVQTTVAATPKKVSLEVAHVCELDGLRGLLSIWVVLAHSLSLTGFYYAFTGSLLDWVWGPFVNAMTAVELFVILSGFAITSLLSRKSPGYASFLIGRAFRLYPAYLACLVLAALALPVGHWLFDAVPWREEVFMQTLRLLADSSEAHPGAHLGAHLTLLHGAIPTARIQYAALTILPVAWSISLEWQYYLMAPLIDRWSRRATPMILLGVVAMISVWVSRRYYSFPAALLTNQLPLFLVGIISYRAYAAQAAGKLSGVRPDLACVAAAVASAVIARSIPLTAWFVVLGAVWTDRERPHYRPLAAARSALRSGPALWLGKVSYSIYLLHWPVLLMTLAVIVRLSPGVSRPVALAGLAGVAIPAALFGAAAMYRRIEKPGIEMGRLMAARWAAG